MIEGLELSRPWALAALPLLLLLPPARGRVLRAVALGLLVTALAGPTAGGPGGEVAILVDVSQSVGDRAHQQLSDLGGDWLARSRTFHFAADAGEVGHHLAPPAPQLDREATDVAQALQVAAASGAGRILLISDGGETRGTALSALPSGVPVDVLMVAPRANARLTELLVPDRVAPGERVEVVAVVESDIATSLRLLPRLDGEQLPPVSADVPAGRSVLPFTFEAGESGPVELSARIEVDYEQSRIDDERSAEVSVSEEQPILVLGDPAVARLLRQQGFAVVEGSSADVQAPLRYSAVIVREPAAAFTPGQLQELGTFVENGGGLMMTGGPDSFGFGGWYRTKVEEVLPVDTDLRTEVEIPLVAMVIVLDRSQSMASGSPSKLELAKEGAIGVIELAYQDDLLGLVVFSDAHEWAFRLRPATERGKREMLSAVLGIRTGGGTILGPAYDEAIAALSRSDAALKHVIILSDGRLYDGQGPFGGGQDVDFAAVAAAAAAEGITTSAIAIGSSADFERLEAIAEAGGGRYHRALDVGTLPQIFTGEALTATRSLLREEPISPVARSHPLSPLEGPLEPVDAYIATAAKRSAETILEGVNDEPVLAVRRHGLGRSAAFTSDLNGWAGDLGGSAELAGLLTSITRWLQARPAVYGATASREGQELRVVVDAVADGEYVNDARLQARFAGRSVALEQVAPGRYEGRLPASSDEGTVLVTEGSEVVARAPLAGPHPEFDTGGGRELLAEISRRTGGEVLVSLEGYAPRPRRSGVVLWPPLAATALALFLAELLYRRFGGAGGRPARRRSA